MGEKINLADCATNNIPIIKDGVIVIAKVKNEIKKLSFFIHYYRMIGITNFIFIDNNSSDGTTNFLLSQRDSIVLSTNEPLSNHDVWIQKVLNTYCVDRWVLIVDIDELLCFPYIENANINHITNYADLHGYDAAKALLLDMYPASSLSKAVSDNSYSPLAILNFYDRNTHFIKHTRYYGGVRKRIFGIEACLSKIPLLKYHKNMNVGLGMHSLTSCIPIDFSLALLHCKFDNDFSLKVQQAIKSGAYWNNSEEYKRYAEVYDHNPSLIFYDKNLSVKYKDSYSLINSGLLDSSPDFKKYINDQKMPEMSLIICTHGLNKIPDKLIGSIKNQTFSDFEIIIIDNNKNPCIVADSNNNLRVIHESQEGLSFARNKGIECSRGKYITFIDDDIILDKYCLEKMFEGAEFYQSDLVGACVMLRKDIKQNLTKKERRLLSELVYDSDIEYINIPKYVIGACMMIRRSSFMKYGLFLTTLGRIGPSLLSGEETEFMKRLLVYGGKVSYIHNAKCMHNIDIKRANFTHILKRAFWQGVTEYRIDLIFNTHKKFKVLGDNMRDTLINCSRLIGYGIIKLLQRYK